MGPKLLMVVRLLMKLVLLYKESGVMSTKKVKRECLYE